MNRPIIAILLVALMYMTGLQQPVFAQQLVLPSIYDWQEAVPAPDLNALKIVVVAGEDGVNIVKKKTAVQPVVEVRDRNNTPVSGIIIDFTTPDHGPTAVFANGSHTFSAVTDANGRVAVQGMQPEGSGHFEIHVTAAQQGHTVGSAVIGQTNFATAAAAASAGAAATTGASSGGLSTGLIVAIVAGVAAAAAAGAVLATHGGGTTTPTATIGVGTATVGAPH